MNLYQFAQSVEREQINGSEQTLGCYSNEGRLDAVAEAGDRYGRALNGRQVIVYKLKAMARQAALDKYPQGAIVAARRLNRNLFSGVHPWTYPDAWGGKAICALPEGLFEIIGYIDQTYQSNKWLRGHIYLVLAISE